MAWDFGHSLAIKVAPLWLACDHLLIHAQLQHQCHLVGPLETMFSSLVSIVVTFSAIFWSWQASSGVADHPDQFSLSRSTIWYQPWPLPWLRLLSATHTSPTAFSSLFDHFFASCRPDTVDHHLDDFPSPWPNFWDHPRHRRWRRHSWGQFCYFLTIFWPLGGRTPLVTTARPFPSSSSVDYDRR